MRFIHALALSSVLAVSACVDMYPDSAQIDPAGGLTREDYLDLRNRQELAEQNKVAPPIPEMPPLPLAPPPPLGNGKLVSITVTDGVPVRDVLLRSR